VPEEIRKCPSYWSNPNPTSPHPSSPAASPSSATIENPVLTLHPVSQEIEDVLQRLLDNTFKPVKTRDRGKGKMPKRLKLLKAHRVENSKVWDRYVVSRHATRQKRTAACTPLKRYVREILTAGELSALKPEFQESINEVYLWHGTSHTGATGITKSGFRLKLAGTGSGTMYGKGLYYAECSSKSDEYAKNDGDGYCLLLCRVVLGEMLHMTVGGNETHSIIKSALKSGQYDSVLGDRQASVGTYREFVIYREASAYPEYMVLYKREY